MYDIFKLMIIISISVLLSACPEPGSDIRTYCRTNTDDPNTLDANGKAVKIGDILRTYTAIDKIQYAVSGVSNGAPISGTLNIDWLNHLQLQDPTDTTKLYTILQEDQVLDTLGIKSKAVRFIVQDVAPANPTVDVSTKGSMYLWAYSENNNSIPENISWTNTINGEFRTVEKILLLPSPINTTTWAQLEAINHYPMTGCAPSNKGCTSEFAQIQEQNTMVGSKIVETIQGTFFEAYEINIDLATIDSLGLATTEKFPAQLDFRHACNNGSGNTSISFGGSKMWIFPEVGIVKYQINCTAGADFYNLTFDFLTSNIPLPASVSGDQNTACN